MGMAHTIGSLPRDWSSFLLHHLSSELRFERLAISESLVALTRPTTDLMLAASMDAVNFCRVCIPHLHLVSKSPLIAEADVHLHQRNATLCENRLGNWRSVGILRSSSGSGTRRRTAVGRGRRWKITSSTLHIDYSTVYWGSMFRPLSVETVIVRPCRASCIRKWPETIRRKGSGKASNE